MFANRLQIAAKAAVTLLSTTFLASAGHAQEAAAAPAATTAPAADAGGAEDIVVTAQKRSERLSKVPIAISAVSGESLAAARIVSSGDLQQVVPGLVTNGGANTGNFWLPYIRGIGSNATGVGNSSSVATYIDGVYQPASTPNVTDFNDIERIEVVKGPQGTLFGRNATGGAINIITRRPSHDPLLNVEASYGRFGEYIGKVYATGPISETLAASLAYQYRGGGDYIENLTTGKKFGGFDNHNVNAKLLWTPSDRFEAVVSFFYTNRSQNDSGQSLAYAPEGGAPVPAQLGAPVNFAPRKFLANQEPLFFVRSYQGQARLTYSFDAVDLVSITGYQHAYDHTFLDFDASPAPLFYFNEIDKIHAFSQEVQLVSNGDGPFKYLAGLFYSNDIEGYAPLTFGIGVPFPPTAAAVAASPGGQRIDTNATTRAYSYAAFGQATYEFAPQTNLTLGIRYTKERRELEGTQALLLPNATATGFNPLVVASVDAHKTFKKPTWRISLDHSFGDDLLVYASYNRGFKSGVYNPTNLTQPAVNPEVLDAYEVGAKAKLADNRILLNVAGFYYDYKNLQVQITQSGSIVLQNAASARLYGLDMDATIQATRNLTIRAGINLLHSEYRDYLNAATFVLMGGAGVGSTIPDASGQSLVYAPKFSANLAADYKVPLAGGSSLMFSGNFSHASRFKTVIGQGNFFNANEVLNGSITWNAAGERYYVSIYGRNLTNKQDIGRYLNSFGLERQLQRPITFGIAVGAKFR